MKLGGKPEITRFKGLGEISPNESKQFIGKEMRLRCFRNGHKVEYAAKVDSPPHSRRRKRRPGKS